MLQKIEETKEFIFNATKAFPEYGIVLGTGLGGLVNEMKISHSLDYSTIPSFPTSSVKGHEGKLLLGTLGGKNVIAMQGRFHYYEGYSMQEITFPIRVMIALGIKKLILSNASGGMNPKYQVGDLVIINDHINLLPSNPLIGMNYDELGPRFPDMSEPYDLEMICKAKTIADKFGYRNHIGVYVAVSGPCFETPAEYRYLKTLGADIVGMSTVPEVIIGRHAGIPCFAISIVTDLGGFDDLKKITLDEVLEVAKASEFKMTAIIKELISNP